MERNCDCVFLYVVVVLLFLTHVSARIQLDSRRFVAGSKSTTRNRDNFNVSSKQHTIKVNMIRAGSSLFSLDNIMNKTKSLDLNGKTDVLITTSFGSVFLDKKKKLAVNRNETVADLKLQVFSKFPGSPPVQIQKLYFSNRLLNDSEVIGNISSLAPLPILLDTISGTGVYNRSMSIAQALEAYVATVVQQAYIGTKLQQTHKPEDSASIASMDSPYFRSLFHSINESLYEKYGEDIALAKEAEREPETVSPDTAAWRSGEGAAAVSPLAAAIAKEFDLNWRGLRNFAYYSVILAVSIAYFYTNFSLCFDVSLFNFFKDFLIIARSLRQSIQFPKHYAGICFLWVTIPRCHTRDYSHHVAF